MKDKGEKGIYFTDYWTLRDSLRFSDFAPALKEILLEGQTPITVGVFGPWGSGKTSLLRMIMEKIDEKAQKNIRTVWFTAWKYTHTGALWRASAGMKMTKCYYLAIT